MFKTKKIKQELNIIRCSWCENNDLMKTYHDKEWGVPVFDDIK